MPTINMKGQKIGRLFVKEQAPKNPNLKSRVTRWICECDCGNTIIVSGSNLRSGNTKSCGCLQKEITSKIKFNDLTNKRFGKLIALKPIGKASNQHIVWECKCDCGQITNVITDNLTRGLTKSCGCNWHQSYGVQKIQQLLTEANIPFEIEVKENINNKNYYWDFVIRPNTLDFWIVEFDGEQHFRSGSESGWNTKENLIKTHERDMVKNNYAFQNNIILIRIPWNCQDNLTINDLLPECSQYIK